MKNSDKNFKMLVAKMDQLKETEKGKLKGGFFQIKSLSRSHELDANNGICVANDCEKLDNNGICIGQG